MALSSDLRQLTGADLPSYFPMGYGGGPLIAWVDDTPGTVARRFGHYEWQPHGGDPIRNAPRTDEAGGVVYFAEDASDDAVDSVLDVMGTPRATKEYGAILVEAGDAATEGFVCQLRILPHQALRHVGVEHDPKPQTMSAREAVHVFLGEQRANWGRGGGRSLVGMFGDNGDDAYERLCFGAMVENQYWGVMRVWSRAWLVTK